MEQYLIDNNVISDYFSNLLPASAMDFMGKVFDRTPNISIITQIEALSWINPNKGKEIILQEFVQDSNILDISSKVVVECVKIRRERKIKTPDAIIAATAIAHDLILLTNDADFKNIPNLKLLNPHLI